MLEAFVDFGLFMSILGAALLLAMLRDDAAQCAFARVRLLPAVPHLFQLSTLAADLGSLLPDRLNDQLDEFLTFQLRPHAQPAAAGRPPALPIASPPTSNLWTDSCWERVGLIR